MIGNDVKVEMTCRDEYVLKILENNLNYYEMGRGKYINNV
jgi:hypothetical protein